MHLNYSWKIITKFHFSFFFHFSPARPSSPKRATQLAALARPSSPAALGLASSPSAAQLARSARSRVSPQRSRISTVRHIRRLSGDFTRSKGQLTSTPENPRAHFLSSSPPLSVAAKTAATEESRASGPLRRRWPPRRRACSPTGEHAAVERPGRGALCPSTRPRVDEAAARCGGEVGLFPFPFSFSLIFPFFFSQIYPI